MFQKDYIPTWLTLFLAIGIIIEYHFSIYSIYIFAFGGILFVLLILSWFYDQKRLIPSNNYFLISMLVFILIGITSVKIKTKDHQIDPDNLQREEKIFFSIDKILKESTYYHSFEAIILQIGHKKVKERILVRFLNDTLERPLPDVDDVFYTSVVLKMIDPPLNPYQFDYKDYLKAKQIKYQLRLNSDEVLKLGYKRNTLKGISHQIRKKINIALRRYHFTDEELSVINAILLGQRQNIDKELFEDYKNAGAVHILAISGLHIGIILLLLNFFLKPIEYFKRGKLIKLLLIIVLLWSFAFLAGLSASVVRAVSMFTAIAIGLFSNRKLSLINALILSMFFLLIFHPFYLFDAGFQLSYLAVFFIITLQPFLLKIWKPHSRIIYYFWQLFTVSISAQIGVLPLSLYYFHRFPGLFFVSGMVIIPFLGLILALGILVIIMALLNILPGFIAIFYGYLIDLMNRFINFISNQEVFIFYDIPFSVVLMLLSYFTVFFGINLMIKRNFRNIVYFLSGIILIQTYLILEKRKVSKSNEFIIFNTYKNTLIGQRKGSLLNIYSGSGKVKNNAIVKDYITGNTHIDSLSINRLRNFYLVGHKKFMFIDSTALYSHSYKPDIVILTGSPKINFERLLRVTHPEMVIIDQNNYRYYIDRWRETTQSYQVKFYSTSQKGAFRYDY